jgi:hypothetical protein
MPSCAFAVRQLTDAERLCLSGTQSVKLPLAEVSTSAGKLNFQPQPWRLRTFETL